MPTTIRVDYENNAEAWWIAAATDEDAPGAFGPMLADNTDELTVSDEDAALIRAWAERLPGWSDGPAYAPTALTFEPTTEDA